MNAHAAERGAPTEEPIDVGWYAYSGGTQALIFHLRETGQWSAHFDNGTAEDCAWGYVEQALGVWELVRLDPPGKNPGAAERLVTDCCGQLLPKSQVLIGDTHIPDICPACQWLDGRTHDQHVTCDWSKGVECPGPDWTYSGNPDSPVAGFGLLLPPRVTSPAKPEAD